MKDVIFDEFQDTVNTCLLRHKSILDILSKLQESQAKVNRAVIKSVTTCGCIKIKAEKQHLGTNINLDDIDLDDINDCLTNHLEGTLCNNCRKIIETELGSHLFYTTSLCNSLDLNLYDILLNEYKNIKTFEKCNIL